MHEKTPPAGWSAKAQSRWKWSAIVLALSIASLIRFGAVEFGLGGEAERWYKEGFLSGPILFVWMALYAPTYVAICKVRAYITNDASVIIPDGTYRGSEDLNTWSVRGSFIFLAIFSAFMFLSIR